MDDDCYISRLLPVVVTTVAVDDHFDDHSNDGCLGDADVVMVVAVDDRRSNGRRDG